MKTISTFIVILLAACGGSQKSGLAKGGDVPPPPPVTGGNTGPKEPPRVATAEETNDYKSALNDFQNNDKAAQWSEGQCRSVADRFAAVVRSHPKLVEAQYMVGLAYHRCNMVQEAERAYQAAIGIKANFGEALSNLGEIYYRAGKIPGARQYWESAVKANGKLIAARIGIASLELDEMRKSTGCQCDKDPAWKKLDEDARFNLSNVLGVDSDNVKAYTLFGLIYMEGYQKNKNRLDLAKTLLDEGKKRNEKFADLQNAYGLWYMHRGSLNDALTHFMAAVESNPKFVEARVNVGLTTLGFRKYDTAKEMFAKAVELDAKRYDAIIGLGIALRGLKDMQGAEEQYNKAKGLDPRRGEAYYNLGVLYKDFIANKQTDLRQSQDMYRKAKGYFQDFVQKQASPAEIAEAKEQVTLCDKTIAQIDTFIKNQANQPPPPATPPAGATPAPPAGGATTPAPDAPKKP